MKKYFAFAAVATMFAACTNEEVTPQVDALTGTPIIVKTNVATPLDGRAVAGMDSGEDVSAYLLNIQGDTDGDTDYFVQMFKYGDTPCYEIDEDCNQKPCTMTWANSNDVTVSALCTGTIVSPSYFRSGTVPVSVYEDQSTLQMFQLSDKLYMPPTTVTPSAAGIDVNFGHLMSKVTVTITGDSEATDVKVDGTYNAAIFSPSQQTWETEDILDYLKPITACKDTDASAAEGVSVYEVILVPQEVAAGTFSVSFVMDGVTYQWTSADAVTLGSGKHYNIELTPKGIDGQGILVKAIKVVEWTTAEESIVGDAVQK